MERGFALEHPNGEISYLEELWDTTEVRMNEGGCDPAGRFYCGSMVYDQKPGAASIPTHPVDVVLEEVAVSNGLEWSPDGARLVSI